jgi:hypothetical protein
MRKAGKSPEAVLATLGEMGYLFERLSKPINIANILDLDICRLICIPQ